MKNDRLRAALTLAASLTVFLTTAYYTAQVLGRVLEWLFNRPWDGDSGLSYFRYYTTLSNLLAAVSAVPTSVCAVRGLRAGRFRIPARVSALRFSASSALCVTMMTVVCFLGPIYGYGNMYTGVNFWYHLVNPVLCILSFLFWEADGPLPRKLLPLGVLPTALYGIVYVAAVYRLGPSRGGWPDFYAFNAFGLWPVSVAVILLANLLFSAVFLAVRRLIAGRRTPDGTGEEQGGAE